MFSDIVNVLLFNGNKIVTPDSLKDSRNLSQYKADDSRMHEQERDVYKVWEGQDVEKVLFGIENQTVYDKDMPFRIMGYDGASYRSQLLKKQVENSNETETIVMCKERYPVITLVLYFGEKKWKGSNELVDCFIPKLPDSEIVNIMSKYISNYQINVFDIGALDKNELDKFTSDFKLVAEYFVNMRNRIEDYIPSSQGIVHVDEFLKLMSVLTGDSRYEEYIYWYTEEEKRGGKVNMCRLLDSSENKGKRIGIKAGRRQGRRQGRKEGEQRLLNLIDKLIQDNRISEIANISTNEELRKDLYIEYGL